MLCMLTDFILYFLKMNEKIPDGSDELFDTSADSGEEYVPASSGESTDGTDVPSSTIQVSLSS